MPTFFSRLERVLRGLGDALRDDPDDVLRQAGAPPPRHGPRPASSGSRNHGGGLPAEVRRAYANLELTPPADLEAAKKAWRKLMAKYHPDRHQSDPQKAETANKVAARLTEAYRVVREHLGDG